MVLTSRCCWWNQMVWSALLSINETRQSPAEQLQTEQPSSRLIATWDDPERSAIAWKRPEKKRLEEGGEIKNFCLCQQLIENTAPRYDVQGCSEIKTGLSLLVFWSTKLYPATSLRDLSTHKTVWVPQRKNHGTKGFHHRRFKTSVVVKIRCYRICEQTDI